MGNLQPGTVIKKRTIPYITNTSPPSLFKNTPHPLPPCRQPLLCCPACHLPLPCGVFDKLPTSLFCLGWNLSLPLPRFQQNVAPIFGGPHRIWRHHKGHYELWGWKNMGSQKFRRRQVFLVNNLSRLEWVSRWEFRRVDCGGFLWLG